MENQKIFSKDCFSSRGPLYTKGIETIMPTLMEMDKNELLALYKMIENRIKPVGIKVVLNSSRRNRKCGYCDVILKMSDESETILDFVGRPAKVLYVYALMNKHGFKRSSICVNREIAHLFSKMYHLPVDKLTGIEGKPLYQAISNSRAAISEAIGIEAIDKEFAFDENMSRNGDTLVIPFAKNGGNIEFINF